MPARRKPKSNDPPLALLVMVQGGRCFYCGEPFSKRRGPTRDHLFPRSMGCDLAGNKVAAHSRCNTEKGSRMPTPEEFDRASALYGLMGMSLRYRMQAVGVQTVYGLVEARQALTGEAGG